MSVRLPPPREPGRYRIGFVCLGNICRSPMAGVVMRARVANAGLDDRVEVASCGTGGWHVGDPMDDRASATLAEAGYDPAHRAQQYDGSWPERYDVLLAMDHANLADLRGPSERVHLFGDHDPEEPGAEVPDPYYGGAEGFARVLAMVERICETLADHVAALVEQPAERTEPA